MLIEGMAQTAGALCVNAKLGTKRPKVVYFMTIDNAKFRRPVVPGDVVEYHMKKLKQRANMWWFRGEAKVEGKVACEAEVSAMLVTE
jgi:3-hydroxyacyl-[acyl-carrier-protein] dehydratase